MALRKVVVRGDEILSKRCREVSEITDRIRETLDDMVDTIDRKSTRLNSSH